MFSVNIDNGFKDLKYIGLTEIPVNNTVMVLNGPVLDKPTRTSIQIGPDRHIEDDLGRYVNHSCNPSVKVVENKLVSVKPILRGDSITFDYNATEDSMSNPFKCHCCGKMISGKLSFKNE